MNGVVTSGETGKKSRVESYGSFGCSDGLIANALVVRRSV